MAGYKGAGGTSGSLDTVAELCNGSTYDSDSYCLGSNLVSAATSEETPQSKSHSKWVGFLGSLVTVLSP